MKARPLRLMLMGAPVIVSTIAPLPTFAENTVWNVQELHKQCTYKGSFDRIFCLEFVSSVGRQIFTNGHAFNDIRDPSDLTKLSSPSACPKSFVSNAAMVEAFSEWANQHLEKWSASAEKGVMQAMQDTWPCF